MSDCHLLPLWDRYDFNDWERLTTLKTVRLRSEQTISRRKSFIAIATTFAFGEEVSARGRVCHCFTFSFMCTYILMYAFVDTVV